MNKKIIFLLGVALVFSQPVFAQKFENDKSRMDDAFQKADIIPDGTIDEGEFDVYHLKMFDALNVDEDAMLVPEECYKACFPLAEDEENSSGHYQFESIDTNRSGSVSEAEYISYGRRQFGTYDTNVDHKLGKQEFYAFYEGANDQTLMVKRNEKEQ